MKTKHLDVYKNVIFIMYLEDISKVIIPAISYPCLLDLYGTPDIIGRFDGDK